MARRIRSATLATLASLLVAAPTAAQAPVHKSTHHDFRVVTVADGLEHPWSIAFLPGGDILVTERPGRLRVIRNGRLLPAPVEGVPPVFAVGQGGFGQRESRRRRARPILRPADRTGQCASNRLGRRPCRDIGRAARARSGRRRLAPSAAPFLGVFRVLLEKGKNHARCQPSLGPPLQPVLRSAGATQL